MLRLAESLGAETVTLDGPSAAATLLEYAQMRNATRVIVGAPKRRGWRAWLRPSTSTQLMRHARGFDVTAIAAPDRVRSRALHRGSEQRSAESPQPSAGGATAGRWRSLLVCSAVAFAMYPHFELANLVMVYLLGVTVAGLRFGRGPSVLTAVLNVAAFDFFFVPPRFTFAVADVQYLVTFGVMLIVALVIANLWRACGSRRAWPARASGVRRCCTP